MPKVIYKKNKIISPSKLFDLYESAKWTEGKNKVVHGKKISDAYKNSQLVFSAWEGNELIGVVRVLTDKANGIIFGLTINPKYQNQGIGTKLIKKCLDTYPKTRFFISSENPQSEKLYKKIGFKKDKNNWFSIRKWVI